MIKKIDTIVEKFAFYGVVVSIILMLGFTVLNIVLRWFNTSILWIDPAVRHLVFLSAFLGGTLATGQDNHIRIDLASKIFETKGWHGLKRWIDRIVIFVTIVATIFLARAGYDFMKVELEFGKEAFLGVHSGLLVGIIPFGMGILTLRFILKLLLSFKENNEVQNG
jgi:TRAP-type C4-dicarboxylate transport system permease small subunit